MLNFIRKINKIKISEITLYAEAYLLSGIVRFLVLILPFKKISQHLTTKDLVSGTQLSDEKVNQISLAINRIATYTPWRCMCLERAITAKWMLRRRNINSTMFMGVKKEDSKKITAHAWLKHKDFFITGENDHQSYTVLSVFE